MILYNPRRAYIEITYQRIRNNLSVVRTGWNIQTPTDIIQLLFYIITLWVLRCI